MNCIKCKKEIPEGSVYCNHCGRKQEREKSRRSRANGMGSVYKEGKSWTVEVTKHWTNKKRIKERKRGFKTKTDAIEYLNSLRGESIKKVPTLKELYEPWKTSTLPKLSASKQTAYKIAYNKLKSIEGTPINQLTIEDLQTVVDEQATTFYPARDMKSLLSHLYKRACAQENVRSNLSRFIELPTLEEAEAHPFSENELKQLWTAFEQGDKFVGYILLMTYSGMMPGELRKCEKTMIDWSQQNIIG